MVALCGEQDIKLLFQGRGVKLNASYSLMPVHLYP
jgi:hypothetical protein